eukprot:1762385-Rhodomonas_salina.1
MTGQSKGREKERARQKERMKKQNSRTRVGGESERARENERALREEGSRLIQSARRSGAVTPRHSSLPVKTRRSPALQRTSDAKEIQRRRRMRRRRHSGEEA